MVFQLSITNNVKSLKLNRTLLRRAVSQVFKDEGIVSAIIDIAIVDDKTSARVNKQFLNHTGPTDVITFPYSTTNNHVEGELVIGGEVASRVAKARHHQVDAELALYTIHGVLHLCGYDDKTKSARKNIRARELHYLDILGLPPIAELD